MPVNVRTAPEPIIEAVPPRVLSTVTVPLLVKVLDIVNALGADPASKFKVAPAATVVVPDTVKFLELVSNVPLVPWPTVNVPATLKLLVSMVIKAPSLIRKLPIGIEALIDFGLPLIYKVLLVDVVNALDIATNPDDVIVFAPLLV